MRVEGNLAYLALYFESKRVEVGRTVRAYIGCVYKLRIRPARLRERCQAGLRLINVEAVIQPTRPGALVGESQSNAVNLSLQGEVELVDTAVARVGGES